MISELEERILAEVQDLPLTATPFQDVAQRLGLDEATVLTTCQVMLDKGYVKRFSVSLSHRKLGFSANPMTAMNVPEDRVEEVGQTIAREPGVTHCYSRSGWAYNLFFMIHDKDRETAIRRAEEIVKRHVDPDLIVRLKPYPENRRSKTKRSGTRQTNGTR